MNERRVFYAAAFVRAVTTSMVGVLIGVYLARLGISGSTLGIIVSAGLLGATLAAVARDVLCGSMGAPRFLIGSRACRRSARSCSRSHRTRSCSALAAFVGMVNGMGKDRGAALILEQAALPGPRHRERARA